LSNQNVFGQYVPKILQETNEEIRSKTERVDPAGWLYFKQNAKILPGDFVSGIYLVKVESDEFSITKSFIKSD